MLDKLRALLAELLGTFALTFVAAGGIVIAAISQNEVSYAARVAAPGLLVMAMIYTLGDISGAHINPVVTLAFALRRAFPWTLVPAYWLVQFFGAILAAGLLRLLFGQVKDLGATLPHYGAIPAFVMELVLTWLLVLVIVGTATKSKLVGPNAGIAVGGTIILCGLFADPVSGASMNPARSLGPMIVSGKLDVAWVYVLAPALGSLLAVISTRLLHGESTAHEVDAATGDAASPPPKESSDKAE